jgi:hypothetical protein
MTENTNLLDDLIENETEKTKLFAAFIALFCIYIFLEIIFLFVQIRGLSVGLVEYDEFEFFFNLFLVLIPLASLILFCYRKTAGWVMSTALHLGTVIVILLGFTRYVLLSSQNNFYIEDWWRKIIMLSISAASSVLLLFKSLKAYLNVTTVSFRLSMVIVTIITVIAVAGFFL